MQSDQEEVLERGWVWFLSRSPAPAANTGVRWVLLEAIVRKEPTATISQKPWYRTVMKEH